jgi:hypothetical protein
MADVAEGVVLFLGVDGVIVGCVVRDFVFGFILGGGVCGLNYILV